MPVGNMRISVQQDADGYLFHVSKPEETGRRKRQQLRFTFSDGSGVLRVPKSAQMREYCDGERFSFIQQIKNELFGAKEYQAFIPFRLFDWMKCGQRLSLLVEKLEEDGTVCAKGGLELMVNSGNRIAPFEEAGYFQCVTQFAPAEIQLEYVKTYLKNPDAEKAQPILDLLNAVSAKEKSGEAEYLLYQLLSTEKFVKKDAEVAQGWLKKAAEKGYEKARQELGQHGQEAPQEAPQPLPDSLEGCLALADQGDANAQFEAYRRLSQTEPEKAAEYLGKSVAGGLDEAVSELEEYCSRTLLVDGDTGRFVSLLREGAEKHSAAAQYRLFEIFYLGECLGRSVKRDKRLALDYLQQAAANGRIEACYRMWLIFEDGNDLLISAEDAVSYLEKAAQNGNAAAMNDLGELYVTGRIVQKDGEKGVGLIQKAAGLGCFDAQIRVYRMALEGRYYDILFDVEPKKAYQLLQGYAREDHNPKAQMLLWESYLAGNPVMLTQPEALSYLRSAAEAEHLPAMFALAGVDLSGEYRDIDCEEGKALLEKGAKLGCPQAQLALFKLYYSGSYLALSSAVNKERAYKWITLSANSYPPAQQKMWELYLDGNEMELEEDQAQELLFAAAREGYGESLYATAELFARGEHVKTDIGSAMKYLTLAAEGGHPKSLYRLYEIYSSGNFEGGKVERDVGQGTRALLLSAQYGYEPACVQVYRLFSEGNSIGVDQTFALSCLKRCGKTPEMLRKDGRRAEKPQQEEPRKEE